jgi:hypothetical protein
MNKTTQKIVIIIVLLAALGGIGYYYKYQKAPSQYQQGLYPVSRELAGKTIVLSDYIRYVGQEGKTAAQLLKTATGSDKLPTVADKDKVWNLYLNAKKQTDSPDKITTHKGDVVEWVLEKK